MFSLTKSQFQAIVSSAKTLFGEPSTKIEYCPTTEIDTIAAEIAAYYLTEEDLENVSVLFDFCDRLQETEGYLQVESEVYA